MEADKVASQALPAWSADPAELKKIIEATPQCVFCNELMPFAHEFGWTYGCRNCGAI